MVAEIVRFSMNGLSPANSESFSRSGGFAQVSASPLLPNKDTTHRVARYPNRIKTTGRGNTDLPQPALSASSFC
jgi:hypothetical protein